MILPPCKFMAPEGQISLGKLTRSLLFDFSGIFSKFVITKEKGKICP